jgi:uncharacterized protein (DUF433 family)
MSDLVISSRQHRLEPIEIPGKMSSAIKQPVVEVRTDLNIDLYGGKDPHDIPLYTIPDAAHLAGVPEPTLRSWVSGRSYPTRYGNNRFVPLLEKPDTSSPLLSFVNVIEAHVLAAIRRIHGVSLKNVRPALDYVRTSLGCPHPLAERIFETDGVDLFVRQFDEVVNASKGGQMAIREFIEAHLTRVEHNSQGQAIKLFPFTRRRDDIPPKEIREEPKLIMVDPCISFGRAVLASSGIPTIAIADRFNAGESIRSIASDYSCKQEEVEEALRYERLAA